MSRYIDVNEFYDKMYEWVRMHGGIIRNEMQAILEAVSYIDIVRCAECKHWHEHIDAKGQGRCDADEHNPFRVSIGISYADFFCSYGEREGE